MASAVEETEVQAAPPAATPTLRSVLEPLLEIPAQQRAFAASHLVSSLALLEQTAAALQSRKAPEEEALTDQDSILLAWLAGIYHGVSGSQAIIHGELLQPEMTASGMVAPFVQPAPPPPQQPEAGAGGAEEEEPPAAASTGARFGVPSNIDVLCDNGSELLRMAAAAMISLYVYLNFRQGEGDLPADEVALTFTTIAIHSCADASNAAAIDRQLQELVQADVQERGEQSAWQQVQQQGQPAQGDGQDQEAAAGQALLFGCAQIRWLMHYVRGHVTHQMAAVQHVLGNREAQADCYHAQQKDMQYLIKALPGHPLGYSLFARCAMNGQQMGVAQAFLAKGLQVAADAGADTSIATMSYQRAAALMLGGAGARVDAAEVQALLQEGQRAREAVLGWFPAPWAAAAEDGDPDRRLLLTKLLPEWERRAGGPLPAEGQVDAMVGVLYVTRTDAAVPPGALQQVAAAGVEEEELGAVPEE